MTKKKMEEKGYSIGYEDLISSICLKDTKNPNSKLLRRLVISASGLDKQKLTQLVTSLEKITKS